MRAERNPRALWPDGHRYAVVVTVDVDGDLAITGPDPSAASLEKTLSIFRYGVRRGAPRLFALFDDLGVRASWFVPGALVPEMAALLRAALGKGHDVGARGRRLERFDRLDADERTTVLMGAREDLAVLGELPGVGFRLPSGEWPAGLGGQLLDAGFTWSSSWTGDDFPFFVPAGGESALVDLPVSAALDDRIAFRWNFSPPMPAGQSRIASYADTLENWSMELDGARREGLLLVIVLHPELCGTPGRISLVEELLAEVLRTGDAWVAPGHEVARWWAETQPRDDVHPVEVFARLSEGSFF